VPSFSRILLSAVFSWIGYLCYDVFWSVGLILNPAEIPYRFPVVLYLSVDLDVGYFLTKIGLVGTPVVILVLFMVWRKRYVPKFPVKGFFLVLGLNFLLILWLASSGARARQLASASIDACA
jgi:high-affinity Fe2+/Pb2+ permease